MQIRFIQSGNGKHCNYLHIELFSSHKKTEIEISKINSFRKVKTAKLILVLLIFASSSLIIHGNNPPVDDYLSIPGPVVFGDTSFELAWSAHPNANYYKHEYLPSGQTLEKFNEMVIIEVITGDLTLEEAVNTKVKELANRKNTDPYANYDVIENPKTGEFILDFIVSDSNGNEANIAEWNAYRYVKLQDKSDKTGVMLFAISRRAYGDEISDFLKILKENRKNAISMLSTQSIPNVTLSE